MAWPCLKWERREEPRDMSVIHKRGEACLICAPSSEFLGGRRAPSTRICWEDQEIFFGAWQSADDRAQDQPILLSPEAAAARVPKPTFGIELWTKMMDSFLSLSHFTRPATNSLFGHLHSVHGLLRVPSLLHLRCEQPAHLSSFHQQQQQQQKLGKEKGGKFQLKLLSHHSHLK